MNIVEYGQKTGHIQHTPKQWDVIIMLGNTTIVY
jgi:hypothetical protein